MSKYYGRLRGSRGEATRQGSENTGIEAAVQSYDGSVAMRLQTGGDGDPIIEIVKHDGSNGGMSGGKLLYCGKLSDLELLAT